MEKNPDQVLRQALALVPKIKATNDALTQVLIDRADTLTALWVVTAADCALFLEGQPGVAKTHTVETWAKALHGVSSYTALMPGIASPSDMFVDGVSIRECTLPDGTKDVSTNEIPGRAATAPVVCLDETFKPGMPPQVLNALLDLTLSGGVRHEGQRLKDHAKTVVGISNETPDTEGEFKALWARYIVRQYVPHLALPGLKRMVRGQMDQGRNGKKDIQIADPITLSDLDVLQAGRPFIEVDDSILEVVYQVITDLNDQDADFFGWLITDNRRFGEMIKCLQGHALINGRAAVSSADLTILRWMMWNHKEHIPTVEAVINPLCRTPLGECRELVDKLLASGGIVDQVCQGQAQQAANAMAQVNACKSQLAQKASGLQGAEASKVATWIAALSSLVGVIAQGFGGAIDRDTAKAAYDAVKAVLN